MGAAVVGEAGNNMHLCHRKGAPHVGTVRKWLFSSAAGSIFCELKNADGVGAVVIPSRGELAERRRGLHNLGRGLQERSAAGGEWVGEARRRLHDSSRQGKPVGG